MTRSFKPDDFERALHRIGNVPALARVSGLSLGYIYSVRHGLIPGAPTRKRIAHALGVDESALWPPIERHDAFPDLSHPAAQGGR